MSEINLLNDNIVKRWHEKMLFENCGIYTLKEGEDPQVKIDKEAEWKRKDELWRVKIEPETINIYKKLSRSIKRSWNWVAGLRVAHRDRIDNEEEY